MSLSIKSLFHTVESRPDYSPDWIRLVDDEESRNILQSTIEDYYRKLNRKCLGLGGVVIHTNVIDGVVYKETYSVKYLIDAKHAFCYHIPIENRNFYAYLALGVGPEYIAIRYLVNKENEDKFSMESAVEGIIHNLKMLDEYLAGRLN